MLKAALLVLGALTLSVLVWHIGLLCGTQFLSNRNAANLLDAAQCVGAVTVIAGDNDCNELAVPVCSQRAQKDGNHIRPATGL